MQKQLILGILDKSCFKGVKKYLEKSRVDWFLYKVAGFKLKKKIHCGYFSVNILELRSTAISVNLETASSAVEILFVKV